MHAEIDSAGEKTRMAGKKKSGSRAVAAACCLLMALMLLLSAQQQPVAAMSAKFCRCYRKCYTGCRKTTGPYPCNVECFQDCVNGMPPPAPTTVPAADCRDMCQVMGFCGSLVIVGDDGEDS